MLQWSWAIAQAIMTIARKSPWPCISSAARRCAKMRMATSKMPQLMRKIPQARRGKWSATSILRLTLASSYSLWVRSCCYQLQPCVSQWWICRVSTRQLWIFTSCSLEWCSPCSSSVSSQSSATSGSSTIIGANASSAYSSHSLHAQIVRIRSSSTSALLCSSSWPCSTVFLLSLIGPRTWSAQSLTKRTISNKWSRGSWRKTWQHTMLRRWKISRQRPRKPIKA